MTDDELRRRVAAELSWDSQVEGDTIEVSAENGTVTLRGTVASLRQKRVVAEASERVRGVLRVFDELQVRLRDRDRRADEDLRGDVREALMLDSWVPMTVDAEANAGVISLIGTAQWAYQREEAESRAASVPGVTDIENGIIIVPTIETEDAAESIKAALGRDSLLLPGEISVESFSDGRVTLTGTVRSWAAHKHAMAAAWSAPGVTMVCDRICVDSSL